MNAAVAELRERAERSLVDLTRGFFGEGDQRAERFAALRTKLRQSPFWLRFAAEHGCSPEDLCEPTDLPHWPIFERHTWSSHWRDMPVLEPGLTLHRSSGSTGTPLTVVKDAYDRIHPWVVFRFLAERRGVVLPARPRVALVCTLPEGFEAQASLPYFEDGELRRISSRLPGARERLAAFQPDVITTDPAGLAWLAEGARIDGIRILYTAAQHLSPWLRAFVEEHLSAPVVDYLSTTETGPVAANCPHHPSTFHVLHPDIHVESTSGSLLLTRLRPSAVPIVRYRTGDRGQLRDEPCACGFHGCSIIHFEGRQPALFVTPNDERVDAWQLAPTFKHHPIDDFRLTQRAKNAFQVEVVGKPDASLHAELTAALHRLGWPNPDVEWRCCPSIQSGNKPSRFVGYSESSSIVQ